MDATSTGAAASPTPTARPERGFRPDIQALRAVAVTAVVLYHLWPEQVPGGFAGVDVFFVISGYLITQHLVQESRRHGRIALTQFWARRIRRLLPAAYTVLAASLALLLLAMPMVTWQQNLEELLASTLYAENWLLGFRAVDYLASENAASLVQHYWSLAAEEQFYLVWPLLIVLALTLARRVRRGTPAGWVTGVLGVVGAVSLAASVWYTPRNPAMAFFATPLRAWEFAAGGLLSLLPAAVLAGRAALRTALSWLGWAVIVASSFLIPGTRVHFPGWIALIPVTGVVLCILAGTPTTRWSPRPAIEARPVQWLGTYSYAIYLWHWPLIIAAPWVVHGAVRWPVKLVLAALTLGLSAVSKRWVEDPVRTGAAWRPRWRSYGFAVAGAVALAVGLTLVLNHLAGTWREEQRIATAATAAQERCYAAGAMANGCRDPFARPSDTVIAYAATDFDKSMRRCQLAASGRSIVWCDYGDTTSPTRTVAVVGNSHSLRLVPALDLYGKKHHWRIVLAAKTDCLGPVMPFTTLRTADCQGWSRELQRQLIARDVDAVVFGTHASAMQYLADSDPRRTAEVRQGLLDTFAAYRAKGIGVVVSGDVPGTRPVDAPACVAADPARVDPCARPRAAADVPNIMGEIAKEHPREVTYYPMSDHICDARTCHAVMGGVVVYSDSHHLTTAFSRSLSESLGHAVEASIRQR